MSAFLPRRPNSEASSVIGFLRRLPDGNPDRRDGKRQRRKPKPDASPRAPLRDLPFHATLPRPAHVRHAPLLGEQTARRRRAQGGPTCPIRYIKSSTSSVPRGPVSPRRSTPPSPKPARHCATSDGSRSCKSAAASTTDQ